MTKISNLIFHNGKHHMTSPYGNRTNPVTNKIEFHKGTDYGTYGVKLPQYAIEDGIVIETGTTASRGNYIWIKYPRLNVKMLAQHLDSINVKNGCAVNKTTLYGYTGETGQSTGEHLHLEIVDLTTGNHYDPEVFSNNYKEPSIIKKVIAKVKAKYTGGSLVDYLKSIGIDSSFTNRKRLATKYGIKNYTGTSKQNTLLLEKMRGK